MIPDTLFLNHIFNLEQDSIRRTLIILCCVTICVWYLQTLWRNRELYFRSWNVPGPLALPIIGSAYLLLGAPVSEALEVLHRLTQKYPKIIKIWFGPKLLYLVHDPVYIEKILNSPNATAKDDIFYNKLNDIFRDSLITAKVHTWRKNRKLISPSFNQRILDTFVEIFAEQSEIFVDVLKKHVGQKNLDIYLLTTRCTLDIICQTAMGVDMHVQTTNGNFGLILEKVLELSQMRAIKIWYHADFIWNLSPSGKEYKRSLEELYKVTGSVSGNQRKFISKKHQD
nr:unnamed protein product [Callosobruchus chinensis]